MKDLPSDFCAVCSTELISVMSTITGGEGYLYTVITGGVRITGIGSSAPPWPAGEIIIPSRIGSRTVIGIGDSAFTNRSSPRGIRIPNSVTSIGAYAFYNNQNLNRIWIPSSVTVIGTNAFDSCYSLTVYAQATSKPSGWHMNWNPVNRPVVWGSPPF